MNLPEYPNQVEYSEPRDITLRVSNEGISATFNSIGLLKSMSTDAATEHFPVQVQFLKYETHRSGAYLFLPDKQAISLTPAVSTVLVTTGNLESSVLTAFPFVIHENIFLAGEKSLEIRNLVDIANMPNTEIIMRIYSGIYSKDVFFTDLNGFEFIKRKRFERLPLQAHYYPIPSGIYIEDDSTRLTLLSAQPLGGSSLGPGEVCFPC